MLLLGVLGTVFGLLLSRSREVADLASSIFGSFVAVTGDAHQAKVAQDIFRQQVRYERSIQIREDMRDVNKLMMESVQTHVIMGSIILGVCWNMCIEGFPPEESERTVVGLWLVFTCWAVTFTLIALWLALRFQMKMSSSARDRLLRRHRLMVPDDLVVGRMGGHNVVNHVANFHSWMLSTINSMTTNEPKDEEEQVVRARRRHQNLRVHVEALELTTPIDAEPLRKGMHAWLHSDSGQERSWSHHTLLDIPFFLTGETLIRSPWNFKGDRILALRVYGESTLYVAAQCPPLGTGKKENATSQHGLRKALWLAGQVPDWPADELPQALHGFHEDWCGENGYGEFRRVEGFSMYVDRNDIEMPLYKLVLADPKQKDFVDVVIRWNFKAGCEALVVVARQGQVHCKEEDWPLAEFNAEVKEVLNLRRYSGLFLRHGTSCLVMACCVLYVARMSVLLQSQRLWWYEPVLVAIAMLPSIVAIGIMPLDVWEKETLFADRRGKAQLEEVNVVTPKSSPIAAPRSELGAPRQGEAVSPSVSRTSTGLQGPARILLEDGLSSSPGLTLPGIEQRRSRMRSQSAPPKERPMVRRLENCCTEMRIGLENCQVVAHDREQLTIRNLRQQAAPPPEPPPPLPSGDAHEILWSGSPVGVSSGDGGGNPEGLGIWGEDKAEQLALQIAKSASSESEKRRRRFSCPKWGYASGLILGARLLELLLALSALSVLITSPAILGSATPISSGEGRSVEWRLEPSTWPALFRPSAALLRGPTLLVAAGPLLRSFGVSGGRWAPLGEPRLLPGAVLGLVSWEGQALALSADGLRPVSNADGLSAPAERLNPLDLVALALEAPRLAALPPRVSSPISRASGATWPGADVAAVVLHGAAGLQLCRASNSSGELKFDFISSLKPVGLLPEITALFFCSSCGSGGQGSVLWTLGPQGQLSAIGFESGRVLATFQAAGDLAADGSPNLLTGNSTHLLLVTVGSSSAPAIFSIPHPVLDFG
ncbi:unnamed protein product [Durusdinium trenchii]|uniref:Phosphatidylglycerophosphatase and protein-tyrosine phosphatase 1 n=2 Tax=Durusdinium trenchii TaxID=1381693 RepID=A0ABP0HJC8_9DINO